MEIKQEQIDVFELAEGEEEEEQREDDDYHDPLSFTAADTLRTFSVRDIKTEPFDPDLLEEEYDAERSDTFSDACQGFSDVNRPYCDIDKVIKPESSVARKKPRKRRPLTLRKRKTPVQIEERTVEHTVVSASKQKYFCFPAANGKQHYFCIPCGRTFPFRSYYMRHEKTHSKSRHVCRLCDRHFSCKSNLDRHFRLHSGLKPLTCQKCFEHFTSKSEFMKHKFTCKSSTARVEPPKPEVPKPELPVAQDSTGGGSFPCYICRQTFDNVNQLQMHRKSHVDFRCRKCNKTFNGGISLSNHLRTHNFDGFKRYSCKICKKNFSNVTSLVSHKRFHTKRENPDGRRVNSKSVASKTLKVVTKPPTLVASRPTSVPSRPVSVISKQQKVASKYSEIVASRYSRPNNAISKLSSYGVSVITNTGQKASVKQATLFSKPPSRSSLKPGSLISKPHLNIRHNILPGKGYCCTVCNKWVKTRSVLKRHMISHTKLKMFSCFICNISMGYASSLHKHMRLSHDLEISYTDIHAMAKVPALEEQEELCREEIHKTPEKKRRSEKEVRNIMLPEAEEAKNVELHDFEVGSPKFVFNCNTCFKNFSNKRLLENHMKIIHMGGSAYKCNTCSKLFSSKHLLVKHAKMHTGEEPAFSCSVCSRKFSNLKTLNNHKGVHTRFKYHTCPICSKSFNGIKSWEQHQRLHMSNVKFRCKLCGKMFFSQSELNEHKKMHIKLKIYSCGECKNSYNSMSALNRHKRKKHDNEELGFDEESEDEVINEEERLYVCSVCDRTFPDSVALSKHKLIHVKRDFNKVNEASPSNDSLAQMNVDTKFECLLCNREFPDQRSLSKHKGWHSRKPLDDEFSLPIKGKKIYVCGFCNRSFATSGSLSKHRKLNCPPKRNCTKNLVPTALIQQKSVLEAFKAPTNLVKTTQSSVINAVKPNKLMASLTQPRVERLPVSSPPRVERAPPLSISRERSRHYPCVLCERSFTSKRALIRHKGWHTRILAKESSPQKNVSESHLERNYENVIGEEDVVVDVDGNGEDQEERLEEENEIEKLLEIEITPSPSLPPEEESTPAPPVLENEKLKEKIAKRRTCEVCFKVYSSSSTLSRHKRLHSRKLLTNLKTVRKPPSAPIPLPQPPVLQQEERTDGLHSCRYCSKAFKFRRHVVEHERSHTGERPFSCNQCSLSFSRRAILWRHQKTHLAVRPFSCSVCPKTFLFNFQLNHHVLQKHANKDVYSCQLCDKKYRTLLALNKHELSHQQT